LKTFQAMNDAPIILGFQLAACLNMKVGKIEKVARLQIERINANENAAPLRPLLGLAFVCIMNRNEYSVIGKNVIFKTFMNI